MDCALNPFITQRRHAMSAPSVEAFFDPATFTYSYVVADPTTRQAAIIDSVLDYDPASGRMSTESADRIARFVSSKGLTVVWIAVTAII